jgi:hypothetical protein
MPTLSPGSLVRLKLSRRPRFVSTKHAGPDYDGNLALIIKSVGKDPNDHEYFEVLVNNQVLHAWDDELEKRD